MVAAEADAQVAPRAMIEVETEVVLVVAPAVEHHAVLALIHVGEEPVRLAAILRDVERVARKVARVKEPIDLIEGRARRIGAVLEALEGRARHALLTGHSLPGGVHVGAGFVGQEEVLL